MSQVIWVCIAKIQASTKNKTRPTVNRIPDAMTCRIDPSDVEIEGAHRKGVRLSGASTKIFR